MPAALRAGICVHEKDKPKALLLMDVMRGTCGQALGLSTLVHSHGTLYHILQWKRTGAEILCSRMPQQQHY